MTNSEKPERGFYESVLVHILQDAAKQLCLPEKEALRDTNELRKRLSAGDGTTFLVVTLPKLGKALDYALATGEPFEAPDEFRCVSGTVLPEFLTGFWKTIFNPKNGLCNVVHLYDLGETYPDQRDLLRRSADDEVSGRVVVAVRAVRQICYLAYKLEGMYPKEAEAALFEKFERVDKSLPGEDWGLENPFLSLQSKQALLRAQYFVWTVMRGFDTRDILPKHGRGAVATGERPHEKMNFRRLYKSIDTLYPYTDYMYLNYSHLCDELQELEQAEELEYPVAKMAVVPKDSRGPRLISMEPLELQWLQQGLARRLMKHIERQPATDGFVNFTNQEVNRKLALRFSKIQENVDGRDPYVTLDLEDASDRVSLWLVKLLFSTDVYASLRALRSWVTAMPNGHAVQLQKYAPMGSALCFPIESLCFWSLCMGAISKRGRGGRAYIEPGHEVYVYGDDLIVRKSDVDAITTTLEQCSLLLSKNKCCTGPLFRESCGVDALNGKDVTPVKCKVPWSDRLSPRALLSWVSYANALREPRRGYVAASDFIEACVRKQYPDVPVGTMRASLPLVFRKTTHDNAFGLCALNPGLRMRFNKRLQRIELRCPVPYIRSEKNGPDSWSGVFASLLRLERKGLRSSEATAAAADAIPIPHYVGLRHSWVALMQLMDDGSEIGSEWCYTTPPLGVANSLKEGGCVSSLITT